MRCPSCNHDNSVDASFCDTCGAKLESICATCGTTNLVCIRLGVRWLPTRWSNQRCKLLARCGAPAFSDSNYGLGNFTFILAGYGKEGPAKLPLPDIPTRSPVPVPSTMRSLPD
jgi:hypothetical protein